MHGPGGLLRYASASIFASFEAQPQGVRRTTQVISGRLTLLERCPGAAIAPAFALAHAAGCPSPARA